MLDLAEIAKNLRHMCVNELQFITEFLEDASLYILLFNIKYLNMAVIDLYRSKQTIR